MHQKVVPLPTNTPRAAGYMKRSLVCVDAGGGGQSHDAKAVKYTLGPTAAGGLGPDHAEREIAMMLVDACPDSGDARRAGAAAPCTLKYECSIRVGRSTE